MRSMMTQTPALKRMPYLPRCRDPLTTTTSTMFTKRSHSSQITPVRVLCLARAHCLLLCWPRARTLKPVDSLTLRGTLLYNLTTRNLWKPYLTLKATPTIRRARGFLTLSSTLAQVPSRIPPFPPRSMKILSFATPTSWPFGSLFIIDLRKRPSRRTSTPCTRLSSLVEEGWASSCAVWTPWRAPFSVPSNACVSISTGTLCNISSATFDGPDTNRLRVRLNPEPRWRPSPSHDFCLYCLKIHSKEL